MLNTAHIQFGNFIEVLTKNLIAKEPHYKILEQYSRQKKNKFALSKANETLIDQYITQCQTENLELESAFKQLCAQILQNG
ncbi:hypothetical protein [Helicobacter felistomachi]|uniref:hypothetical protein n=1 Tax=Helicobacter felistomachi TaxID=3040201 RepID=UPI002574129C|nr:hypothetical protein [Helicobacter sp. NHP21005]